VFFSLLVGSATTVKSLIDAWMIIGFVWRECRGCCGRVPPEELSVNRLKEEDDDPFSSIAVDADAAAPVDPDDEVFQFIDLNPTEECDDVFGIDAAKSFSDDPLRDLFRLQVEED
jgi:hypothetical protein